MFFFFGTRSHGIVHECDDTFVASDFFCVNFLPLVPVRTYAVVHAEDGSSKRVELRASPVSIAAGYLRVWSAVPAIAMLGAAFISAVGSAGLATGAAFLALASPFALTGLLARLIGRLSKDDMELRRVYAEITSFTVDAALLPESIAEPLRAKTRAALTEQVPSFATATYRTPPSADVLDVAVASDACDAMYLCQALTLSRLEWACAKGPERRRLADIHAAIWTKLRHFESAPGSDTA